MRALPESSRDPDDLVAHVRQAMHRANRDLADMAAVSTKLAGAATTCSLIALVENSDGGTSSAVIAQAGDSGVYRLRNGDLERLTREDQPPLGTPEDATVDVRLVDVMPDDLLIAVSKSIPDTLTPEEIAGIALLQRKDPIAVARELTNAVHARIAEEQKQPQEASAVVVRIAQPRTPAAGAASERPAAPSPADRARAEMKQRKIQRGGMRQVGRRK